MTRNTGRAQCAHTADPCNKVTQGRTGAQHGFRQALERLLPGHEFADARLEPPLGDVAELEAEAAQDAPQAELEVVQPGLQLLARDQQGPDLLRMSGDMRNWTEATGRTGRP